MERKKQTADAEIESADSYSVESLIDRLNVRPYRYPYRTKFALRGEAKYLTWDFSKAPFKTLDLLQVTDMQYGNVACKVDRVIEFRDWVLAAPNRYMIWTGDNVDAAHMLSKGTTWDNVGNPESQVFKFCEIWAPAAHRILGYVGGNHERRTITTFGDLGRLIAALLKIPYSGGKQLIDVKFGEHTPFQISQWHGAGGARTKGTVAQTLNRFAGEGDSRLYLMGHLHQAMIIPFFKERRGEHGVKAVRVVAAMGSSFLETWGSYGEVMGFGPSDVVMPCCTLERAGGWEVRIR